MRCYGRVNRETGAVTPLKIWQVIDCGTVVHPDGALAQNFAFDVTPHELVAGIITEMGVLESPFEESIRDAFERAGV